MQKDNLESIASVNFLDLSHITYKHFVYMVEIILLVKRYIIVQKWNIRENLNNIYQILSITDSAEKVSMVIILIMKFFLNCQNNMPSINRAFLNMYTISTVILGHLLYENMFLKMNNKNKHSC